MAWGDRAADGTFANLDDRMSLALNRVDDETNLHTVTIGSNGDQKVVIDTLQRYCIKFVDVKVPEVDSIFLLHNQKYVCQKSNATYPQTGVIC